MISANQILFLLVVLAVFILIIKHLFPLIDKLLVWVEKKLDKQQNWVSNAPYTRIVQEAIFYSNSILYDQQINIFPFYRIDYRPNKERLGRYNGEIVIYLKNNKSIPELVDSVLHEIQHYIQSLKDPRFSRYNELTALHGYQNNPLEIEAREFAHKHLHECLKYLEGKHIIQKV